jgi:hypothetical protein
VVIPGQLYAKVPIERPAEGERTGGGERWPAPSPQTDVAVEVDERELGKLKGFAGGVAVLIEATVTAAPDSGMAPASYRVFRLGDTAYGLTAITSPPPEKGTTVVSVRQGLKISLRIVGRPID